jgi:hypothetical protein
MTFTIFKEHLDDEEVIDRTCDLAIQAVVKVYGAASYVLCPTGSALLTLEDPLNSSTGQSRSF